MTCKYCPALIRAAAHVVAGTLLALGLMVVVHYLAQIDMQLWPCERTVTPRHADSRVASPGQAVRIRGEYQIVVDGCEARFYPIMDWVTEAGDVQLPLPEHRGSFRLRKNGPRVAQREHRIPFDALPGSEWTHRVIAVWDKWHLPMGLSEVNVEYREVKVLVVPAAPGGLGKAPSTCTRSAECGRPG